MSIPVLKVLAADYPQLYLNPDEDSKETYRNIVLRGEEPAAHSLAHYRGDPDDMLETAETPAGPVRVVTLGNRHDFELVMRGLLAAKEGPLTPVPESQGAAMLTLFNWPRIHAHLALFPPEEQDAELRRFTSVKANYIDRLVVLSRGPYSHTDAAAVGCGEAEWLALSDTIRRNHELTHVICRRQYPDQVDAVKDELIADAIGLYAAFGRYDPDKALLFLGIRDGRYVGGRLENYTDDPEGKAPFVCTEIRWIESIIRAAAPQNPFDLIPLLMKQQ